MYFVDPSMFTGDIFIPNLEEKCTQDIQIFKLISKWEKECLELILGKALAAELLDQFEITGEDGSKEFTLKSDAETKWTHLIEGRKYQEEDDLVTEFLDTSSSLHYWDGLITKTDTLRSGQVITYKESLIAYYIYFMWCLNNISQTTGTGEMIPKVKNSVSVSSKMKRTSAFNYFWTKVRCYDSAGNVGLHMFLKEHRSTFPSFEELPFKNMNIYDI